MTTDRGDKEMSDPLAVVVRSTTLEPHRYTQEAFEEVDWHIREYAHLPDTALSEGAQAYKRQLIELIHHWHEGIQR